MDILDIARFWSRVEVKRGDQCWPWRGPVNGGGYGEFKMDGRAYVSSRVSYMAAFGDIPDGYVVRHTCDNPRCCNPKHLLTGTHADNVRDRVIRQRSAVGESASNSKLTEAQVLEIRSRPKGALQHLAECYGVTKQTIEAIRYRRSWKHLP